MSCTCCVAALALTLCLPRRGRLPLSRLWLRGRGRLCQRLGGGRSRLRGRFGEAVFEGLGLTAGAAAGGAPGAGAVSCCSANADEPPAIASATVSGRLQAMVVANGRAKLASIGVTGFPAPTRSSINHEMRVLVSAPRKSTPDRPAHFTGSALTEPEFPSAARCAAPCPQAMPPAIGPSTQNAATA